MARTELNPSERAFIAEYLVNGNNATAAVKKVWPKLADDSARVKGSRLLTNDNIRVLLDKTISDELLARKHKRLLEQKQLAYFVFSKQLPDDEIKEHMLANGLDLIVIRESDKGKMAFYSIDDAQAISKAIDMGYKLKGSYAPEKSNVTVVVPESELPQEDKELLALIKTHDRNSRTKTE